MVFEELSLALVALLINLCSSEGALTSESCLTKGLAVARVVRKTMVRTIKVLEFIFVKFGLLELVGFSGVVCCFSSVIELIVDYEYNWLFILLSYITIQM